MFRTQTTGMIGHLGSAPIQINFDERRLFVFVQKWYRQKQYNALKIDRRIGRVCTFHQKRKKLHERVR